MTRLHWTLIALLASAVAVGIGVGGARGTGIVLGAVAGGGLTMLALLWQRHVLHYRPERVFAATLQGFLVKLFALALLAACLRYVPQLNERADWRAFLVAYAMAVLALQALGTAENLRFARTLRTPKEGSAS